jgi:hypothetical protein
VGWVETIETGLNVFLVTGFIAGFRVGLHLHVGLVGWSGHNVDGGGGFGGHDNTDKQSNCESHLF